MRHFDRSFTLNLIRFLSDKTEKKKSSVNSHAMLLLGIVERTACIYNQDPKAVERHLAEYVKAQKRGRYTDYGTRLTYQDIAKMIWYTKNDRGKIAEMIKDLQLMGYLGRAKTGFNVNAKGQKRKDASYKYSVNLKKLIEDMGQTVFIESAYNKREKKQYKCLYGNHKLSYMGIEVKLKETFGRGQSAVKHSPNGKQGGQA